MLSLQDVSAVTAMPGRLEASDEKIGRQKRREFAANWALTFASSIPGLTEEFQDLWGPSVKTAGRPQKIGRFLTQSCVFALAVSTAITAIVVLVF